MVAGSQKFCLEENYDKQDSKHFWDFLFPSAIKDHRVMMFWILGNFGPFQQYKKPTVHF